MCHSLMTDTSLWRKDQALSARVGEDVHSALGGKKKRERERERRADRKKKYSRNKQRTQSSHVTHGGNNFTLKPLHACTLWTNQLPNQPNPTRSTPKPKNKIKSDAISH